MAVKKPVTNNKCTINVVDKRIYERQAQICKAFANPVRLQILEMLSGKELQAADVQAALGVTTANLSQHMSVLKSAGVVSSRREGKQVFYAVALPEVEQACQLVRKVLHAQVEGVRKMKV